MAKHGKSLTKHKNYKKTNRFVDKKPQWIECAQNVEENADNCYDLKRLVVYF